MPENPYAEEVLHEDEDNGTMPANVGALADAVVGHRIVKAERLQRLDQEYSWRHEMEALVITLDNGHEVQLFDTGDCCAFTELREFLLHPDKVDHVVMGIGTTDEYSTWHIYADYGDILQLTVAWSCGNPFYYGYGFEIRVVPIQAVQ